MASILLSTLLPTLFGLAFVVGFLIFLKAIKKRESAGKGTLLFELDIRERRIKTYDRLSNNVINSQIFNHPSSAGWVSLSELTNHFIGTDGEKKFRYALVKSLKAEEHSFSFTSDEVLKKGLIKFDVKINKIDDVDSHVLCLSWDVVSPKEELVNNNENLSITDLSETEAPYKGFIAFALNSQISDVENKFIVQLSKVLKFHHSRVFFGKGLACIPFFEKDKKKIKKKMELYIKTIKARSYRFGLNRIAYASAQILSRDVNTPKRVNDVLKTLDFLVNLSIRHKEEFLKRDSKHFTDEEYKEFVEGAHIFRLALRAGNIKPVSINVCKYKSKKKIIEYIVPTIDEIPTKILASILRNGDNRSMLIDAQAKNIAIEDTLTKPSLFDVNADWICKNKSKIVVTKSIYVVNFPGIVTKEHVDTIMELKEKGFVFAIRVKFHSKQISTLIMDIKPQFIIIDSKLASAGTQESFIQLIAIKKVAHNEKSKLIFENPSPTIGDEWAKKISLDFCYKY